VEKVSKFFFSGSSIAKLDDKGRIVIPHNMRNGLIEDGKCECVLALGVGGCLSIYRPSAIQKIVEKFREKQYTAQYQWFFTFFFSTLHQTECDKIGRLAIPSSLKNAIDLKKELVVAGVIDKIELWPKEIYDQKLRESLDKKNPDLNLAKMTEEAFLLVSSEPILTQ